MKGPDKHSVSQMINTNSDSSCGWYITLMLHIKNCTYVVFLQKIPNCNHEKSSRQIPSGGYSRKYFTCTQQSSHPREARETR